MISLSDASSNPWTMMIMYGNTTITNITMKNPRSLNNVACWAFLADNIIFVVFDGFAFVRD